MGMETTERTLQERLNALSPGQRAELARRLSGNAGPRRTERDALIAFVVGRNGAVDEDAVRARLRDRLPDYMVPRDIVVLDSLPRLPNGKIDRNALHAVDWTQPEPDGSDIVAPRNEAERTLSDIWCDVLGLDSVSIHDDFFEVGGDSLISIRILSRANQAGLKIRPELFFEYPTIAGQAAASGGATVVTAEPGLVTGTMPLMPIQHWFFERIPVDPQQWNQSALYTAPEGFSADRLERSVQHLMKHHDALRLRFPMAGGKRQATFDDMPAELPVVHVDLSGADPSDVEGEIVKTAEKYHARFDLETGPLVCFVHFTLPAGQDAKVLVIVHHLLVDAVSWCLLSEHFDLICGQIMSGEAIALPDKTTSLQQWAMRLKNRAEAQDIQSEAAYWRGNLAEEGDRLPTDFPAEVTDNRFADTEYVSRSLDEEATQTLLQDVCQRHRAQIDEILMAALAGTVCAWTGRPSVTFDLEGHGREAMFDDMDVSHTVGWFTTVFPVRIALGQSDETADHLASVKDRLRRIANGGIGYGLLRDMMPGTEISDALRQAPRSELLFNYLGQVDLLAGELKHLRLEDDQFTAARSPRGIRAYVLEVNARISCGRLRVDWSYASRLHNRDTVLGLANDFMARLQSLIGSHGEESQPVVTAADFPLANLDQDEFAALAQLLDEDNKQ